MGYEGEKDDLFRLRDSYIKELKNLKMELKKRGKHGGHRQKKNVRFRLEIEKINERGNTSISRLNQCACDLECILKGNEWKCRRRKERRKPKELLV